MHYPLQHEIDRDFEVNHVPEGVKLQNLLGLDCCFLNHRHLTAFLHMYTTAQYKKTKSMRFCMFVRSAKCNYISCYDLRRQTTDLEQLLVPIDG